MAILKFKIVSEMIVRKKCLLIVLIITVWCTACTGQEKAPGAIQLNQTGFYPYGPKIGVVVNAAKGEFFITTSDQKTKVFTGKLSEPRKSEFSDKKTSIADFSELSAPGTFVMVVPGVGSSHPFEIRARVHEEVAKASIKGFYYQRMSVDLPERYAGQWHRRAGHPDKEVLIHASAASENRPTGTVIACPRGWYDAGDYNKYIVNSGITMATLFAAYEDFTAYYDTLALAIPEQSNTLPDLLDESLWNLRWMLTMQDPHDGGVYHKCTNAKFDGMIMPDRCSTPRYAVQKGTAATLDFAAVMAQASRIFKKFNTELPGLSDSCLTAAKNAWSWAIKNPGIEYDQDAMNKKFAPKVTTGGYGDRDLSDEWIWAAAELYAAAKDDQYIRTVKILPDDRMPLPSWGQVRLLGYYTLVRVQKELPPSSLFVEEIKTRLLRFADELIAGADRQSFKTVMGKSAKDYIWGSSAVAANQSIALLQAYHISGDKKYVNYAITNLDYLLGRNATGYSFLTGYGERSTLYPHHRPSIADGIAKPVPGLLAGGPNPGMQDKCRYLSTVADEAYTDDACSYASNEIAINWNAPMVYLTGAMEALQFKVGYAK
jgi:endoglucanase